MAETYSDPDFDARLDIAAEAAFRVCHQAENLQRQAMAAGRAAAASLKLSAMSALPRGEIPRACGNPSQVRAAGPANG